MKSYRAFLALRSDLENQILTLPQVVDHYLQNIQKNNDLNAFVEVFAEEAKREAQRIQQKIISGKAGKLAGMVIGIKDNICYRDHGVSACSKMLKNYISPYSATVVERLLVEDAIIIGRLNCDEFAMGASNESSYYGPVKNAFDRTRVSGGSSGGSAVAVQADLCFAALGTDTGGSVRQPAAFCGIVGLKPSYGRISRHGILSYASSFDQVGTLTKSVEDAALLLEIMAGRDQYDSTSSRLPVSPYSDMLKSKGKKKIAYFIEALQAKSLDEEVRISFQYHINQLQKEGHIVEPISFDYLDYLVPTYYILTMAEASSNLARYDGIRYGYRSAHAMDLESTYKRSRTEGFGIEVKRRILLGTFILSAGYYEAYYTKAQQVRRLIRNKTEHILAHYDFIMLPTAPTPAFPLEEKSKDPVVNYLADIFTVQASLVGVPAISLPAGTSKEGLPLGLQFLTKYFSEEDLLAFAKKITNEKRE
ncbi:MAG: Asp-tRNA(Asn)/Glu-tRNA(Gln) amidotransferase subunit GatA [Sphingobacteriaceae bacterium]|jgi:aspartyl-tRNA(Asn)/glutamyl-tRNA(Gln) amidotransferase subunit A|nr:MAG: Asp-tRNA(Asn)/Glu-tRNA(Gln) amidotransferase subunit GatA [Pedobacter sp.]